jgi:hypothetical protein
MTSSAASDYRASASKLIRYFQISSMVTGVFLVLVMATWGLRRLPGLGFDLWLFGQDGFFSLESYGIDGEGLPTSGLNLTNLLLIVHGWLYVVYLFIDFRLWTLFRWPFARIMLIALGGIVPLLSFFTERRYARVAREQLASEAGR